MTPTERIFDQQQKATEALRLNPDDRLLRLWLADWVMEEVLEIHDDPRVPTNRSVPTIDAVECSPK